MDYLPIIGLEVHVELKTKSKMFCGCDANYFGQKPNTHCCPVCLGLPGALPVPNKRAIEWCIQIGLALNCQIPLFSQFDRKNYFYPDLPKGYQISQTYHPFAINGWFDIKLGNKQQVISNTQQKVNVKKSAISNEQLVINSKRIRINRVHMEEDTGKLLHRKINGENCTLIDFNRSGVPLVEIVTEPDFHSAEEAKEYLKKLQLLIRFLGVSDADMEKGSMRCEPNISLTHQSAISNQQSAIKLPDYKVEVKNINSFRFAEDAINYEIKRQYELLSRGEKIKQETRRWNEEKKETYSQRSKEEAKDYRYFPEPDIPPFVWSKKYLEILRKKIPVLPEVKLKNYREMGIPEKDAQVLLEDQEKSRLVDEAWEIKIKDGVSLKEIVNAVVNKKVEVGKITPLELRKILSQNKSAKISDTNLLLIVILEVLKENSRVVSDYQKGKKQALAFLIGQIMKKTKGQADPQIATQILLEKLQGLT